MAWPRSAVAASVQPADAIFPQDLSKGTRLSLSRHRRTNTHRDINRKLNRGLGRELLDAPISRRHLPSPDSTVSWCNACFGPVSSSESECATPTPPGSKKSRLSMESALLLQLFEQTLTGRCSSKRKGQAIHTTAMGKADARRRRYHFDSTSCEMALFVSRILTRASTTDHIQTIVTMVQVAALRWSSVERKTAPISPARMVAATAAYSHSAHIRDCGQRRTQCVCWNRQRPES